MSEIDYKEMIGLLESIVKSDGWNRGLKTILQQNAEYLQDQILNSENPDLDKQVIITERDKLRIKRKEIVELLETPEKILAKLKETPQGEESEQGISHDPYPTDV